MVCSSQVPKMSSQLMLAKVHKPFPCKHIIEHRKKTSIKLRGTPCSLFPCLNQAQVSITSNQVTRRMFVANVNVMKLWSLGQSIFPLPTNIPGPVAQMKPSQWLKQRHLPPITSHHYTSLLSVWKYCILCLFELVIFCFFSWFYTLCSVCTTWFYSVL